VVSLPVLPRTGLAFGKQTGPARLAYTRDLMTAPGERVTRRGASYAIPPWIILLAVTPTMPGSPLRAAKS
jgi:hypothetical protein